MDIVFLGGCILINGVLFFYSETGTEGGFWAIQDEKFINHGALYSWSYEGLYVLKTGDALRIYTPERELYWEGTVNLVEYPIFSEYVSWQGAGLWIHHDQSGVSRDVWAKPFMEGWHGEVITK